MAQLYVSLFCSLCSWNSFVLILKWWDSMFTPSSLSTHYCFDTRAEQCSLPRCLSCNIETASCSTKRLHARKGRSSPNCYRDFSREAPWRAVCFVTGNFSFALVPFCFVQTEAVRGPCINNRAAKTTLHALRWSRLYNTVKSNFGLVKNAILDVL